MHRYREIISVWARHGFGDLLAGLNLDKYLDFGEKYLHLHVAPIPHLTRAQRVRMALEELGPAFIKLGQMMSNRPDLLSSDLLTELEKLQDAVPPFPDAEARTVVEAELGGPIDRHFANFGATPVASASMAQVHKAVLLTGEEVAVKVQRPGLDDLLKVDLEIMFHLAALLERYVQGMNILSPVTICEEFERTIKKELDFSREASQLERFANAFSDARHFKVPKVYGSFTTRRLLVLEYIHGVKVTNRQGLLDAGLDPKAAARNGAGIIFRQIFELGYFHADPHPGNILVLEGNVICLLDYGMVGSISPAHRDHLVSVLIGMVERDAGRISKTLMQLAVHPIESAESLEYHVGELLDEYVYVTLRELRVGDFLRKLIRLILEHKLKMLPGFYLLLKTVVTVEGVAGRLDPEFDMVEQFRPFARRIMRERLSPKRLLSDLYHTAWDLSPLLREFPSEARGILDLVKRGKIRIEFQHRGLEPLLEVHERIVNRIVFALVLASLVIGSSLVVLAGVPPTWQGIPIIGLGGFSVAALLGFWLLVNILRKGKIH